MQRNSTDPYKCLEITVLKKSRSDEARELLERVAKQVQPIMRKRCWTVKRVGLSPLLLLLHLPRPSACLCIASVTLLPVNQAS